MDAIFSNLIKAKPGETWDWQLDAAAAIEQVDERHIDFALKKGMPFTDGFGELTADDVWLSFERIADPENESPYRDDWGGAGAGGGPPMILMLSCRAQSLAEEIRAAEPFEFRRRSADAERRFDERGGFLRRAQRSSPRYVGDFDSASIRPPHGTAPALLRWQNKPVRAGSMRYAGGVQRLERSAGKAGRKRTGSKGRRTWRTRRTSSCSASRRLTRPSSRRCPAPSHAISCRCSTTAM